MHRLDDRGCNRRNGGVKSLLILVTVGGLIFAGFVVWMFPPLTYDVLPWLWESHHKKILRERTQLAMDHLRDDDIDACLEMIDPGYLQEHGRRGAMVHLAFAKLIKLTPSENVRIDEVKLEQNSKTAMVLLSYRLGNRWNPLPTSNWVRVDGTWYITFPH